MSGDTIMPVKKKQSGLSAIETKLDLFKEHLDSHMQSLGQRLERVDIKIEDVNITLAEQKIILDEHIRRTNILEDKFEEEKRASQSEIQPLKVHSENMKLMMKVLIASAGVSGAGLGIKEILSLISG